MDTKQIESVVLTELHDKHGLDSLHVQNHIYGCFILMEDIAETNVKMEGVLVSSEGYSINIDVQFSEIGIRYGFLMDTSLEWNSYHENYKKIWMELFTYLNQSHDIKLVENIEDMVLELLKSHVKEEDSFLLHALEEGALSRGWQDKVIKLIKGHKKIEHPIKKETEKKEEEEEEQSTTGLGRAHVEKPVRDKYRGLHKTRRHHKKEDIVAKKMMSTTRRALRK